jgi:hypothetical protein
MGRKLNPEIALGFLIATVVWIGVLGWQASYAPPDSEKRQCEEAATKPGQKTEGCKTLWERTTSDPVAFFTFWLVVFTGGLTVSTVLLWRAGERQIEFLRESSATQTSDMRDSIAAAARSADAAQKAAEVAEKSLTSTERAFVFLKYAYASPVYNPDKTITGWDFHILWENAGPTPTQHMISYKNLLQFPGDIPPDFAFPDVVSGSAERVMRETFVGPKATVDAGGQFVPLSILHDVASGNSRLFGWGWAEYGDVFRKDIRSRSEYCFEIVINGALDQAFGEDVKPPFVFKSAGRHTGSEDECYRRPGDQIPILRLS